MIFFNNFYFNYIKCTTFLLWHTNDLKINFFFFEQKANFNKYCFWTDWKLFDKWLIKKWFIKEWFKKKWIFFVKKIYSNFNIEFDVFNFNFEKKIYFDYLETFFFKLFLFFKKKRKVFFFKLLNYFLYFYKNIENNLVTSIYIFIYLYSNLFFFNSKLIDEKKIISHHHIFFKKNFSNFLKKYKFSQNLQINDYILRLKNKYQSTIFLDTPLNLTFSIFENVKNFSTYYNCFFEGKFFIDIYSIQFCFMLNWILYLNKKFKLFKFYNFYSNSMNPIINYSIVYNYYYSVDLPIMIDYFMYFSTATYYNLIFFNIFFKKGNFFYFLTKKYLLNFEIFFVKKNIIFDPKFYFFKKIKFFFNNFKYINLEILNWFRLKHTKMLIVNKHFNVKYYCLEYFTLINDFISIDYDRSIEWHAVWEISEIWITTLIEHILKLWKEKKPDDKAQYSPTFNHLHELAMYLRWGWELEHLLNINNMVRDWFYGTFFSPVLASPLFWKKFKLINFNYIYPQKKFKTNSEKFLFKIDVSKNLFWKQLLEFIDINLSSAIMSYRESYKTELLDLTHLPTTAYIFDNNWAILTLNFIYISLFWKVRFHYFKSYLNWSWFRAPWYFWFFFSKEYYENVNLLTSKFIKRKSYKKYDFESLFDLYSLNSFFYSFLFKLFFFSKKKIKKLIKGKFFYNQLWLNIFWSYKSFILPSKNSYDDINFFPEKNQLLEFCPKTLFLNNISFFFETNIYIYSEIFFPFFFFDWNFFFDLYKKNYYFSISNRKKNIDLDENKNFFFKKKILNLFVQKQYLTFKDFFMKIFITYFTELIYEYYLIFRHEYVFDSNFKFINLEKNDFLSDIFSTCFNHRFFSSFNSNYLNKNISNEKKYILFILWFLKFLNIELAYFLITFWKSFIEFFFSKIWDFAVNIDEKILLIYFNLYLINFFYDFVTDKDSFNTFLEKILSKMFYWMFIQFSTESNEIQFRKFLFSDFYLWEFYPNVKIFFYWYFLILIKVMFR